METKETSNVVYVTGEVIGYPCEIKGKTRKGRLRLVSTTSYENRARRMPPHEILIVLETDDMSTVFLDSQGRAYTHTYGNMGSEFTANTKPISAYRREVW